MNQTQDRRSVFHDLRLIDDLPVWENAAIPQEQRGDHDEE